MAESNYNETALDMYGNDLNYNLPTHARPPLSNKVKEERREMLRVAFANGPHLSQVQRRKDNHWILPLNFENRRFIDCKY